MIPAQAQPELAAGNQEPEAGVLSLTLLGSPSLPPRAVRAHAMKNCLAVVLGIARAVTRELSEHGKERMACLEEAALRLKELLAEDLRQGEISSAVADRADVEQKVVCARTVLSSVLERVGNGAKEAGIRLVTRADDGEIPGDVDALTEALFNVVANAIEATPGGGTVSITMRTQEGGDQEWCVEDRGCGMTTDEMQALGRPYRSNRPGGSGLGVAIAKEVVAQHGGCVRVESRRAVGTTITLCLPTLQIRKETSAPSP